MVRQKVDPSLDQAIVHLVDEMTVAANDILGNSKQWKVMELPSLVTRIVARETSRVFQGKDLCRNERWLQIAGDHTMDTFIAAIIMRNVPALIRPLMQWILPHNIKIRKQLRDASKLIAPEVEQRQACSSPGKTQATSKSLSDTTSVEWMTEIAQGRPIEWGPQQLCLLIASVGTTGMTTSRAIVDLCTHSEVVQPLREELVRVLQEHKGWNKAALYNMKLLDSFLKESTRVHPVSQDTLRS